jgi:hypothetical protein
VPLVVIIALVIAAVNGTGGPDSTTNPTSGVLPPVNVPTPARQAAEVGACAKVTAKLPVQLGPLAPRIVHAPSVVAWGDPAVVLACGVGRPADLKPGSSTQFVTAGPDAGPFYDVTSSHGANVFTTVDRAAYISVTVPAKYQGANVMPPLSRAIAAALPPVCSTDPNEPDPAKLCTRRK